MYEASVITKGAIVSSIQNNCLWYCAIQCSLMPRHIGMHVVQRVNEKGELWHNKSRLMIYQLVTDKNS